MTKIETPVDPRTNDKPTDTPGHVTPGADLWKRLGVSKPTNQTPPAEDPKKGDDKAKEDPKPKDSNSGKTEDQPQDTGADPAATKPDDKSKVEPQKVTTVKSHRRKVTPRQPVAPAIGTKQISEIVTAATTAAVKAVIPEAKDAQDPLASLSAKQKRDYEVLKRMESNDPKHKGKAEAYVTSVKKYADYISKWETANPGKQFNDKDEEHQEFISANEVTYPQEDFIEAMADLRAEARIKENLKPVEKQLADQKERDELQQKREKAIPEISQHRRATAKVFFKDLGETYQKVLNEGGVENPQEIARLLQEHDVARDVFSMALHTEQVAGELMSIAKGIVNFSKDNPLHVEIFRFAQEQEQKMEAMPDESKLDEHGHMFLPSEQYNNLPPDERKYYWTFSDRDLSAIFASEMSDRAKRAIEEDERKFNARLQRKGIKVDSKTQAVAGGNEDKTPEDESFSPAGTVAPRLASVNIQPKDISKPTKSLLSRITGR